MLIKVDNSLDINASFSFLSNALSLGAGTVPVKNISSFYANWAVQIGKTGEEQSEVKILTSFAPSGTALILTGTTTYDHSADTPIYATKFDQVVFKRSTVGTAGTATAITNGTVTITPDGPYTVFDDTTGASTYAYKTQFRNSVTGEVSSESDWQTTEGFSFYSLGKLKERIKRKLFGNNIIQDDAVISDWINEWVEKMNNVAIDVNKDYSYGTVDVSFGTSGLGTISATDYKDLRRLWVTYNAQDFYLATKMDSTDFLPTQTFNTTIPQFYFQGDTVFGIKPEEAGGTARISYYKLQPILVNDTDELPSVMKGYSKSFVDYAYAQALYLDDKDEKARDFNGKAEAELERFRLEIAGRHKSGPEFITLIDAVSGENEWEL